MDSTTFANTGTITVDGTSAVTFKSALTTAQLGTVHAASGATLDFAGTLNNIKATFHVGAGVLLDGAIDGGTINGAVNLTASGQSLAFLGGPTVKNAAGTGPGTINVTGEYADLYFDNTQTFNNATINLGNTIGYTDTLYAYDTAGAGGQVLTLASGVTVDVVGYAAITSSSSSGDGIVNKGVINDTTSPNAQSDDRRQRLHQPGLDQCRERPEPHGGQHDLRQHRNHHRRRNERRHVQERLDHGATGNGPRGVRGDARLCWDAQQYQGDFPCRRRRLARRRDRRRHDQRRGQPDGERPELGLPRGSDGEKRRRNRPGTINVTGEYADLYFDNTQTFNNATINLGNTIGYTDTLYAYDTAGAGGQVLTLASGVTVDVVGYAAITSSSSSGDGIVNKGVINDTTSPNVGSLTIEGNAFTNQGSINVENGQNLTVDSTTFANTGTITVDGTSAVT